MKTLKLLLLAMAILIACPQVHAIEYHKIKIGIGKLGKCYWDDFEKMTAKYKKIEAKNIINEMDYGVYDVYVTCDDVSYTTEQVNEIVDFVKKGGGLIVVDSTIELGYDHPTSDSVRILLRKLGINITESELGYGKDLISLDGKTMIEHPVTTGVETLRYWYDDTSHYLTEITGVT